MFSWSTRRTGGDTAVASSATTTATATAVPGSIRPPDYSRQQHLDSYLRDDTLQKSTRRVSSDDSTYDTVFQTVTNVTMILRVHLPPLVHPSAPCGLPQMTLAGIKARHEWLDSRMQVIGYGPLSSDAAWRQSRLLLGAAVHQVIQHLQVHPPEILEITDKGLRAIQPQNANLPPPPASTGSTSSNNSGAGRVNASISSSVSSNHSSSRPTVAQRPIVTDAPPAYESSLLSSPVPDLDVQLPSHFSELDGLSREKLDKLLEDELEFIAFCNQISVAKELQKQSMTVVSESAKKAKENLEKEKALKYLHDDVKDLQSRLKSRLKEFEELEQKQNEFCAPPDPRQAIRDLNKGKRQAFQESEKMAEQWLDSPDAKEYVDQFCDQFLESRKLHHMRAAKMELLQYNNNGKSL